MCQRKKYKVVLFDLDGTLTDPAEGIINCVQYALQHLGIQEHDMEKLKKFIGPPLDDSFMEFYEMDYDTAWKAVHKYRERYNTIGKYENRAFAGIEKALQILSEKQVKIGLATSKPEPLAIDIMEKYDLAQYFDEMTGSDYEGTRHEKYQVIEEALRRMGIGPEDYGTVLMIGDRKHDIIGAKKVGIDSMGVRFGYAPEGELEEYAPEYIVNTIEELACWFRTEL